MKVREFAEVYDGIVNVYSSGLGILLGTGCIDDMGDDSMDMEIWRVTHGKNGMNLFAY